MEIKEELDKMRTIQSNLLQFIDEEDNCEENFENLIKLIEKPEILKDRYNLNELLHIILNIANYHHRGVDFFSKIENILQKIQAAIKTNFNNWELFKIFKSNKRILLFLFKKKIIKIDELILKKMEKEKYETSDYLHYFSPEIKEFFEEKDIQEDIEFPKISENLIKFKPKDYNQNRMIGERDHILSSIIRNDQIDKFTDFIEKQNILLNDCLKESIFETNLLLLCKNVSLIEYAAFYGSIKIFKYLLKSKIEIKNTTIIYQFAVHSNNEEMFDILEKNQIKLENKDQIETVFIECIICHHNAIANKIRKKYSNVKDIDAFNPKSLIVFCLRYYNFLLLPQKINFHKTFCFYACIYNHSKIVQLLIEKKKINIAELNVFNLYFLMYYLINMYFTM